MKLEKEAGRIKKIYKKGVDKMTELILDEFVTEYPSLNLKLKEEKGKVMRTGVIAAVTKDLLLVKFKNHTESFRLIDILCEDEWVEVQILQNKEWITINKTNIDKIRNNKILKHILSTKFIDI